MRLSNVFAGLNLTPILPMSDKLASVPYNGDGHQKEFHKPEGVYSPKIYLMPR